MTAPVTVPPHSIEAEMSVLGAILQGAEALNQCSAVLRSEDFYLDAHAKIFAASIDVARERGEVSDLVTVTNELRRRGELEDVGSSAFLSSLVLAVPTTANVIHHAGIIREKAEARRVAALAYDLAAAASADDGWQDRLSALAAFDTPACRDESSAVLVTLSTVVPEPVSWLWPGRVARGKTTLIIGNPGMGKSALTLDLAARVSTGGSWPDGTNAPRGNVILLTAEDGLADTVRPRLDAMGGDSSRVHVLQAIRDKAGGRGVDLTRDVAYLEAAIVQHHAALMIADPLNAYLGKTDATQDVNVRRVLAPLAALAEHTDAALVVVMHLTKDSQRAAIYRAQGSVGFVAAARAVFVVAEELGTGEPAPDQNGGPPGGSESPQRFFACVKMNIAAKPPTLAFTLQPKGESIAVEWDPTPRQVDVGRLLESYEPPRERGAAHAAGEFLTALLASGPLQSEKIFEEAEAQGLSRRTLWRAKKELGIQAVKVDFGGGWTWRLPTLPVKSAKSANHAGGESLAAFAEREQLSVVKERTPPKAANCQPPGTLGNLGNLRDEAVDQFERVEVER